MLDAYILRDIIEKNTKRQMNNIVFLFSKDCMSLESLPCYSSTGAANFWRGKTPNIDELANKGTMFMCHYTAAPSTSMAMSSMMTGKYPYEFKSRKRYESVAPNEFRSLFDIFQENNYECHLLWDYRWMKMAWRYVREFGDESKTIIHNLPLGFSAGKLKKNITQRDDALLNKTCKLLYAELEKIDLTKKQFIWLHLPHVLLGRKGYMDDMDVLDDVVGYVRHMVGDDSIYFTTDHGHMNMHKGKFRYGFDVYQPAIHIPLITPKIDGKNKIESLTSNIDLPSIILNKEIPKHSFVISEIKYFLQPHRKVAVLDGHFKYIYNDDGKKEELYDLKWDPLENYNILDVSPMDHDRHCRSAIDELYFYPYRNEAMLAYNRLKAYWEKIWYKQTIFDRANIQLREKLKNCIRFINKLLLRKV